MGSPIKRAVIRRMADDNRIPIAAAAHRYACLPIKVKQRLCEQEERQQARLKEKVGNERL